MAEKATKKKKSVVSSGNSRGGAQQFLVWHGEKIAVGIVVVVALWFAIQGLGYQALDWKPDVIEKDATDASSAIAASTRTAKDEGVELPDPDHKIFAEQITRPVLPDPYRNPSESLWSPGLPIAVPGIRGQE